MLETIIGFAVIGVGLLFVLWLLRFLWRIGFFGFVGARIIVPAIVGIAVGVGIYCITGDPVAIAGGSTGISLVTFIFGSTRTTG
jgi:hypothetical protein